MQRAHTCGTRKERMPAAPGGSVAPGGPAAPAKWDKNTSRIGCKPMFEVLKSDLRRYLQKGMPLSTRIEVVVCTPGIWVICIYRMGSRVSKISNRVIRKGLMIPLRLLQVLIGVPAGIDISFDTRIGKGFYIGHYGGIVLHHEVEIGEYCNISHGVTIGLGGRGETLGCPKLGDRVYIGPGAKVFGKITIGNDVAIGANAVVLKDVPDRAVVGGVPAKILNFKSSSDFIRL